MDDHSDDIRRPSQRIEVYAGTGRKRWPDDMKAQIAAESLEPGAIVTSANITGLSSCDRVGTPLPY